MELHYWIIFAWIALPTVMFGGASLLRLIERGNVLTPAQISSFRAGHAHAGVLILMSLLYYICMSETGLFPPAKFTGCTLMVLGILAQSGGFLIRLSPAYGRLGTKVTLAGAVLLVAAIVLLVYGLVQA
jgi:hypothetical protein